MTSELHRFNVAETELLDRVYDRMLVPLEGPTAPPFEELPQFRRLIRTGMLHTVVTTLGEAVEIGQAARHGPWEPCGAVSRRDLGQVFAVSVLRARLELQGFVLDRYLWRDRPGPFVDRAKRRGVPDAVYMHAPPDLLAAVASDRSRRDRPDAGACLCLTTCPDPTEATVRRILADHRAAQPYSPSPVILGVKDPEAYRTLAQEIAADHWGRWPTGHLRGDLPVPLPPLLPVRLQGVTKAKAKR